MTYWLLETCLVNAVVASLLAAGVLLLGRYVRRPALLHALWVLVLVKLITPPLIELPVGIRFDPLAQQHAEEDEAGSEESASGAEATAAESTANEAEAQAIASAGNRTDDRVLADNTSTSDQPGTAAAFATVISHLTPFSADTIRQSGLAALVTLWLGGSAIWFLVIGWRLLRFYRFLRYAPPAPSEINIMARRLAAEFADGRTPDVRVVDSRFSPMLWAAIGGPKVILPKPLIDRMDDAAIESLLVHELAHYHRRDYLVRVLEIVVTGLFWWHPVVWLAKSEIEKNEEQCCDAWVVDHLGGRPRPYAEALLATIDFLAEGGAMRLAPGATGLGDARIIRHRMQMIFTGETVKSMTLSLRRAVVTTAVCVLALGPQVFAAAAKSAVEADAEVADVLVEPATEPVESVTHPPRAPVVQRRPQPVAVKPKEPAYQVPPAEPFTADVSAWAQAVSQEEVLEIIARTDGTAVLVDHRQSREFEITQYRVAAAAFSPDERLAALASNDHSVYVIDGGSGDVVAWFAQPQSEVRTVDFSPDGKTIAAGSEDGTVHLFDVRSTGNHSTFKASAAVNSVRFSPDGELLAVASGSWLSPSDGELLLWNVTRGETEAELASGAAQGIADFANDGKLIAADWDGSIAVYDVTACRTIYRVMIDKNLVSQAGFSPANGKPMLDAVDSAVAALMTPPAPVRIYYEGQTYEETPGGVFLVVPQSQ